MNQCHFPNSKWTQAKNFWLELPSCLHSKMEEIHSLFFKYEATMAEKSEASLKLMPRSVRRSKTISLNMFKLHVAPYIPRFLQMTELRVKLFQAPNQWRKRHLDYSKFSKTLKFTRKGEKEFIGNVGFLFIHILISLLACGGNALKWDLGRKKAYFKQ